MYKKYKQQFIKYLHINNEMRRNRYFFIRMNTNIKEELVRCRPKRSSFMVKHFPTFNDFYAIG